MSHRPPRVTNNLSLYCTSLNNAGGYSVIVSNFYGGVTSVVARLALFEPAGALIDVAFSGSAATGKKGFAATGVATNDFWNTFQAAFSSFGSMSNLEYSDGTISGAGLTVVMYDFPAVGMNGASDPMYGTYLAPSFGGSITLQVTNLSPGAYDFYLYGHGAGNSQNSVFQLMSGAANYGSAATTTNAFDWLSGVWLEGAQYVEFTNVEVFAGQKVSIVVAQGAGDFAALSGLQIKAAGLPLIAPASNQVAGVIHGLVITNSAFSPNGPVVFALGPNSPEGATISYPYSEPRLGKAGVGAP